MKEFYGTLSETINGLKEEGYTLDFNIREDCLACLQTVQHYLPMILRLIKFTGLKENQTLMMNQYCMQFHLQNLM